MFLHDIQTGDELRLELFLEGHSYFIATAALHTENEQVWIQAFPFQGSVFDFTDKKYSAIRFHLHGYDKNREPVCWKNVQLTMDTYQGASCYRISCQHFHSMGIEENRRARKRIPVSGPAELLWRDEGVNLTVKLYDISGSGVAFLTDKGLDLVGEHLIVEIKETVLERSYGLKMECVCVRKVKKEKQYLYGCRFQIVNYRLLEYVFCKHLEVRARELAEKRKKEESAQTTSEPLAKGDYIQG